MLEPSSGHAAVVGSIGHMVSGFRRVIGDRGWNSFESSQLVFGGVGVGGSRGGEATEGREKGRQQDST